MSRRPVKTTRLYQQVAEKIARAIATGTYKLGERLPAERDLALQNKVSRPTVREAIIALELDGLVEVKLGSGVYVAAKPGGPVVPVAMDVGAFELTEARLLIEGEVAALAATLATPDDLAELDRLLNEMAASNARGDARASEAIDRGFHTAIAEATHNSALVAAVEQLWTIRDRSPQCVVFFDKSRAVGNLPVLIEHHAVAQAVKARDAGAARAAMRDHLSRVLASLLDATEVEAIEEAKARMAAQRSRFTRGAGV